MSTEPEGTYPAPRGGWVCFHCGERFTMEETAREHFGPDPADYVPACVERLKNTDKELINRARMAELGEDTYRRRCTSLEEMVEQREETLRALATTVGVKGPLTVHELRCFVETWEGRAMAAEAVRDEMKRLFPRTYAMIQESLETRAPLVDLYTLAASVRYKVPPHEVTPEQREETKRAAHRLAYGGAS